MAHDFHDGDHTDEWPAQDRRAATDGTDGDALMAGDALPASDARADEGAEDVAAASSGAGTSLSPEAAAPASSDGAISKGSDEAARPDDVPDDGLLNAEQRMDDEGMFAADDSDAPVHLDDVSDQSDDDSEKVELHSEGARDIDATSVWITQGGARDIEATNVTINQGGAARIRADELTVSQGGVALARTERLTLGEGGSAFAVVADNVNLDPEASVFLLVARSTTGDIRPILDWRAAAAFGAGFALFLRLLRRGRR